MQNNFIKLNTLHGSFFFILQKHKPTFSEYRNEGRKYVYSVSVQHLRKQHSKYHGNMTSKLGNLSTRRLGQRGSSEIEE